MTGLSLSSAIRHANNLNTELTSLLEKAEDKIRGLEWQLGKSIDRVNQLESENSKLVETLEYAKGQLMHAGYTKNAVPYIEKIFAELNIKEAT